MNEFSRCAPDPTTLPPSSVVRLGSQRADPADAIAVRSERQAMSSLLLEGQPFFRRLALIAGRSLFPLLALVVLAGTFVWGPWVSLALAVAIFAAVSWLA
jgi:hypothetical protein